MSGHGPAKPMTSRKSGALTGVANVPGDKSVSHRALIFGAMTVGETRIEGLLEGQDVLDTAKAMRAFGADVEQLGEGSWRVHGVGVGGFAEPEDVIDCGNSGTGVRLIMGAMATSPITATFSGDASLRSRPMGRITDPISLFGARSHGRAQGRLPLTIIGAQTPVPVEYRSPVPSAQVKSAVLLAGLNAPGVTTLIEAEATRDHTERMLRGFGAEVDTEITPEGRVIRLTGQPELTPVSITVPRDPSSAAFPVCAALIAEGSDILVPNISLNPTRAGLYATLRDMGADLTFENEREEGGEPVADLRARFSPDMKGVETPPERAASMIDEFPVLSVVAANATGKTVMLGVKELRVKESDRIDAMARGLAAMGVTVEETEDTFTVHGMGPGGVPGGGTAEARLDHRIAMSFLVLGVSTKQPVSVDDGSPIDTSFPIFEPLMQSLGADLSETAENAPKPALDLPSFRRIYPAPDVADTPSHRFTLDGGGREIVTELLREVDAKLMIEVGCYLGGSVHDWLECKSDLTVIGVDPWEDEELLGRLKGYSDAPHMQNCFRYIEDRDGFLDTIETHGFYLSAVASLKQYGKRFVPMRAFSPAALYELRNMGVKPDVIYIDSVKHRDDLDAAWECFPDARLCGDDWSWNAAEDYPMRRAVEGFCADHGLTPRSARATWVIDP